MAYYYYNKSLLPQLPIYDSNKYPYAVVIQTKSEDPDMDAWQLFVVDKPIFATESSSLSPYRIDAGSTACIFIVAYLAEEDTIDWIPTVIDQTFDGPVYTDATMTMIWSNHDITLDDGTVHFKGSTPRPESEGPFDPNTAPTTPPTVATDIQSLSFLLGWLTGRRIRKTWSDVAAAITGEDQSLNMNFDPETLTVTFEDTGNIIYETAHNSYKLVGDTLTINNILTRSVNEYVTDPSLTNACLYNGVRLPALPTDAPSDKPYAYILSVASEPNIYYLLYKTSQTHITTFDGDEGYGPNSANVGLYSSAAYVAYKYDSRDSIIQRWAMYSSGGENNGRLDMDRVLLWSNYDIKFGDNVYLAASTPIPVTD